jgi:hypothetical protein
MMVKKITIMNRIKINTLTIIILLLMYSGSATGQSWQEETRNDNRAIIVVTGMKVNEDTLNYGKDPSVAEGAKVKLTTRNGATLEKKTEIFSNLGQKKGEVYFSADFPVIMDSTYNISMTFKNGSVIRINNFCLRATWKTHFYYHSTNGTVSPASVLRKEMDAQNNVWCYVYGLFPLSNYKKVGGTQVK